MTVTQTTWTPASGTRTRIPTRSQATERSAAAAQPAAETLMTIRDVANACKLSETAVRRAVYDGELQAVKLRSRLRITRQDFDAWITAQRQPAARVPAQQRPARPANRAHGPADRRTPAAGTFRALMHADADQQARSL
ncbi:MAG: helix-turn-helix domain-containing protein [Solirubrobacteraceae bacterium]